MKELDWNDLRFVLAVARDGSAAAAARSLGVSHATVLRRIASVEQAIGSPLFDRQATGYVANDAGRTLSQAGEVMARAIQEARRSIEGKAAALSGKLKFTTTDSLALEVGPLLKTFKARFPDIEVDMVVTNHALDLGARDADVTLRPSPHPPETWVGMRVAQMDFALYASNDYLQGRDALDLQSLDWLWPDGALSVAPASRWLKALVSEERAVLRVDSFVAMQAAVRAGLGAAVLPRFLGDHVPEVQRIADAPGEVSADVWLLTHPSLRQSPRIQAFLAHMAEGLRAQRGWFAPSSAPAPGS